MHPCSLISTRKRGGGCNLAAVGMFAYCTVLFVWFALPGAVVVADRSFVTFMRDVSHVHPLRGRDGRFEEGKKLKMSFIPEISREACPRLDYGSCAEAYEPDLDRVLDSSNVFEVSTESIFISQTSSHGDEAINVGEIEPSRIESARQLLFDVNSLRDVSPPGMWPPQDDSPPPSRRFLTSRNEAVSSQEMPTDIFQRRAEFHKMASKGHVSEQALSEVVLPIVLDISPPSRWSGWDNDYSEEREVSLLDLCDMSDSSPGMWLADHDDNDDLLHNELRRRALLADLRYMSPPGLWSNEDGDNEYFHHEHNGWMSLADVDHRDVSPPRIWSDNDGDDGEHFHEVQRWRNLLAFAGDISPPGLWSDDNIDDESVGEQRRRLLSDLGDISPAGLWSDGDSDDENFGEQRRCLLSDLGDISPPGLWSDGDSDDENFREQRRTLLSDLGDISPPGLWSDGDIDDENFGEQRRTLLSDVGDISPSGLWSSGDSDDGSFGEQRRSLLSVLGHISRSGLWSDDDSDDENFGEQRRTLLSNLRDISPPGLWPDGDSDDERFGEQRRTLLSVVRDISPPGLWPDDDSDDESFGEQRRTLLADLRESSRPGSWAGDDSDAVNLQRQTNNLPSEFRAVSHSELSSGLDICAQKLLRGSVSSLGVRNNLISTVNSEENCNDEFRSNEDGTSASGAGNRRVHTSSPVCTVFDLEDAGNKAAADYKRDSEVSSLPSSFVNVIRNFPNDLMSRLRHFVLHLEAWAGRKSGGVSDRRWTFVNYPTVTISNVDDIVSAEVKAEAEAADHPWKSLIASIVRHHPEQLSLKIEGAPGPAHSHKFQRLEFPDLLVHHEGEQPFHDHS